MQNGSETKAVLCKDSFVNKRLNSSITWFQTELFVLDNHNRALLITIWVQGGASTVTLLYMNLTYCGIPEVNGEGSSGCLPKPPEASASPSASPCL